MYPFKIDQEHRQIPYHNKRTLHAGRHNGKRKDFTTSYYVYGKSAAIEFVCDETRKQHINTITLQAASARPDGERGYDWDNKTVIQLPRNEMLMVAAVLLGMYPRVEYRQSNGHASKSYSIEHQDEKIFVMVGERGRPIRAVGMSPEDTYHVVSLFLRQLKENAPWLTVDEIITLIDMTVVRMRSHQKGNTDLHPGGQSAVQPAEEVAETAGETVDTDMAFEDDDELQPAFPPEAEPNYNF